MKYFLLAWMIFPFSAAAIDLPCTYVRGDLCVHVDRSDNLKKPRSRSMGYRMTAGGEVRMYFWKKSSTQTINISESYAVTTNLFMKGVCGMDKFYSQEWKKDANGAYLSGGTYVMTGDYSVRLDLRPKNSTQSLAEILYKFTIPFE